MAWDMHGQHRKRHKETEVTKTRRKALAGLFILTCFLYVLPGCASKAAYHMVSLDKPWVKKGEKLIHPDKTIIRFEKPRYYKGRLTEGRKDDFYRAVTPEKLLSSWGVGDSDPVITKFSKRWEPRHSSARLHKLIMEVDYYGFSSASGYKAGGRMATKRVVIYRYMGANITNRMGIGIMGYSDHVLLHSQEFNDLVDSMSF